MASRKLPFEVYVVLRKYSDSFELLEPNDEKQTIKVSYVTDQLPDLNEFIRNLNVVARERKIKVSVIKFDKINQNIELKARYLNEELRTEIREILNEQTKIESAQRAFIKISDLIKKIDPSATIWSVGSMRRKKPVVKDLDLLIKTSSWNAIKDFVNEYADTVEALGNSIIRFHKGRFYYNLFQLLPNMPLGAALLHFTGSFLYNVILRRKSKMKGWKLSQYGLFDEHGKLLPSDSEEDIQRQLGVTLRKPEERP